MVLTPLLVEMESMNERLDLEEFVESCVTLYNTLDITHKKFLMDYGKQNRTKYQEQKRSHTPIISRRSQELVSNNQNISNYLPVEDRLMIKQ